MSGIYTLANLQTVRMAAGHSVTTLAHLANVSDRTIQSLENGGTDDAAVCQRIADVLGKTLVELGAVEL